MDERPGSPTTGTILMYAAVALALAICVATCGGMAAQWITGPGDRAGVSDGE